MGKLFDGVRAAVTAEEAAERYVGGVKRGFMCCPLHGEKTPSMKFYPNGKFYCFGCHAQGTSIDFVAKLFDLSPLDAAKRINADFALGLSDDVPDSREIKAARAAREARQREKAEMDAEEKRCYALFVAAERVLNSGLNPDSETDRRIAEAAAECKGRMADTLLNLGAGYLIGY